MSTRCAGAARRMFSTGTRLWPPASTLPSPPTSASTASASGTVAGRWYVKAGGFMGGHFRSGAASSTGSSRYAPGASTTTTAPSPACCSRRCGGALARAQWYVPLVARVVGVLHLQVKRRLVEVPKQLVERVTL